MAENLNNEITNLPSDAYDTLIAFVDTKIYFEDKNMKEWRDFLILPSIPDYIDNTTIIKLNQKAVQLSETIFTNYSISKARNTAAKAAYNKKLNIFKEAIRNESTSKISTDVVENKAINQSQTEASALTMSELYLDFWKYQVEKINAFNTRLTSLNITINQENKLINNQF